MEPFNHGDRPPDAEENPGSWYCQRLGGQARPKGTFQIHSRKTRITRAWALRHPQQSNPDSPHPTPCIYRSISLFTSTRSIMLFNYILSCPLATLVYLCKLLWFKCYPQNATTLLPLSFSPGTLKATVISALILSPIHLFRSTRMHNLYQFPTLSRALSISFQNLSLSSSSSLGPYPTITQTLIQRIIELTHPKSTTAL